MNLKLFRFWKVNFKDWLWFVFYLKGDEFSHKLDVLNYFKKSYSINEKIKKMNKLSEDRSRAHKIDNILNN